MEESSSPAGWRVAYPPAHTVREGCRRRASSPPQPSWQVRSSPRSDGVARRNECIWVRRLRSILSHFSSPFGRRWTPSCNRAYRSHGGQSSRWRRLTGVDNPPVVVVPLPEDQTTSRVHLMFAALVVAACPASARPGRADRGGFGTWRPGRESAGRHDRPGSGRIPSPGPRSRPLPGPQPCSMISTTRGHPGVSQAPRSRAGNITRRPGASECLGPA